MKPILIPTDFSPTAQAALTYAAGMAQALGSTLVVFYAHQYTSVEALFAPSEVLEGLHGVRQEAVFAKLQAIEQQLRHTFSIDVQLAHEWTDGFASQTIVAACAQHQPELLVLGINRKQVLSNHLLGNVTTHVMNQVPCPVWIPPAEQSFKPIRRLAFATDFKEKALPLYYQLARLAHRLKAQLTAVHIHPPNKAGSPYEEQAPFLMEMEFDSIPLAVETDGDVAHGLTEFVRLHQVDAMAILPHLRGLWQRILHKSITRELVLHSEIPLLVLHERDASGEGI